MHRVRVARRATPPCLGGVAEVRASTSVVVAPTSWDPRGTPLSVIARRLDRLGHSVHPYRGLDRDPQRRREDRALLIKIGVAGAAVGNLMLLAIALNAGEFGDMSAADTAIFRWASLVVAVPALTFAATPFFRAALAALRARGLHLDLPLSIGILAGLVWGYDECRSRSRRIYFNVSPCPCSCSSSSPRSCCDINDGRRPLPSSYSRSPRVARGVSTWRASARRADRRDRAWRPHCRQGPRGDPDRWRHRERLLGTRHRVLTGESRPVDVSVGTIVHAGTANIAAPLVIRATAVGEATRVGHLVSAIDKLSARKAPIERLVDRIAGRFVAVVTTVSAITMLVWSILVSPAIGAEHAMALLIVTCPCALALATPLAVTVALGRAAREAC